MPLVSGWRAEVPGRCLAGGKDRLDERLARIAEGGSVGEHAAMKAFESSRPTVAAMAVGVARAASEFAADYSGLTRARLCQCPTRNSALVDVVVADGQPGQERFASGVWADGEQGPSIGSGEAPGQ